MEWINLVQHRDMYRALVNAGSSFYTKYDKFID
jgi:hypothetical protein